MAANSKGVFCLSTAITLIVLFQQKSYIANYIADFFTTIYNKLFDLFALSKICLILLENK